jgi:hypothetical protein
MVRFVRWSRNIGITLAALLIMNWVALYLDEWIVRWRGEALLERIKTLEVNHSLETNVGPLVAQWRSAKDSNTYCRDGECRYVVRYRTLLHPVFFGDPNEISNNWPSRILDHLGLRESMVSASLSVRDGVVVGKSFEEDVALPVSVWFERQGAYVPDLTVSSGEIGTGDSYGVVLDGSHLQVRRIKGEWGLGITYDSTVDPQEKARLSDFGLQCITQLSPCLNEREISPEGERLLEGHDP